jgi:hypothetical protein
LVSCIRERKQAARIFEKRVLRRIFGPNGEEVTGGWRKLHNEELHNLQSSANIIRIITPRRIRWIGHIASRGEIISLKVLVGKPKGRRPLGKPTYKYEDNIKMNLKEIGWVDVSWIQMT